MHSQRAFSLLEILIALTILVISATIVLPDLKQMFDRASASVMKNQLVHAIEIDRQQALLRYHPTGVCMSADDRVCSKDNIRSLLIFLDNNEDGSIKNKRQLLFVIPWRNKQGELHWRSFPFYREYLLFFSDGRLRNDNGTVWYCDKIQHTIQWAVVLNKSSAPRAYVPDQNDKIYDAKGQPLPCDNLPTFFR